MNQRNGALLTVLVMGSVAAAAPLTGDAQSLVMRLARAGDVSMTGVRWTEDGTTKVVSRAFNAQKYCLTEPTLNLLQRQPTNVGVQAMVFLEFRCVNRIQGKVLTPELALAFLRSVGYTVSGSNLLTNLLNNPPAANALAAASQTAVTPMTPRN
ncbi:hypothetical protein K7W42_02845 [Deinococcus sp. HMF7604]|uniref:hypothetical protein n=1 Tax=Deinococcus betulae TaxID=2873312 RepID=UPI001CCEBC05|nr:hypothetical protein [Deinococcus betulae]MBZ9749794.1 hypothetical protein [Deinococcus betulae]